MRVVVDTNVLIQIFGLPVDKALNDPVTGNLVSRPRDRAAALVAAVDAKGGTIVIPTPVLAEYLVGIPEEHQQARLAAIGAYKVFEVAPFGERAAIECSRMLSLAEFRQLDEAATKAKVRFDRQIVAIALAVGADELWTHDKGVRAKAIEKGIRAVRSLAEIEPKPEQAPLDLHS